MKRFGPRLSGSVLGVAAATLLLYLWILGGANGLPTTWGRQTDYDNLLAHGFLSGHLYLDQPVPEPLLRLANPYDPAQRPAGLGLHDASLYRGRYYIYFGPVPVALVMLPFLAITGKDLPIGYAVGLFAFGTYLAMLAWFWRYRRVHHPAASRAATGACLLAISACGFQLALLSRHSMYELPIACGSGFFLWALYCLLRGADSGRKVAWCLAGGLALGLAIAARPTYIFASVLLLLPLAQPRGFRGAAAAAGACGGIVAALLLYNFARFGSVFEFGQNYQLSGAIEGQARHFGIGYLPFNLRVYFLSALRWGRYFPFVHRISAPPLPAGFGGYEESFGLFPNLPFYLFAAAGLSFAVRAPRTMPSRQRIELSALAAAALILVLVFGLFFGSVVRYEGDFCPPLLLLAACGVLELDARMRSSHLRTGFGAAAAALAAFSAFVAIMSSLTLYRNFAARAPAQYGALGRWLNLPAAWVESLSGYRPGPIALRLAFPSHPSPGRDPLLTTGWPPEVDGIWAEYPRAGAVRFLWYHGSRQLAASPAFELGASSVHDLTISLGSLYPPDSHPYFQHLSAEAQGAAKGLLELTLDRQPPWRLRAGSFESTPGAIAVGSDRAGDARFSGTVLSVRRQAPDFRGATLPSRHIVLNLTLRPDWIGRSFPLVTRGHTDAGDTLFLRVVDRETVQFGYDHWGKPTVNSDPIPWPAGQSRPLEIDLPSPARTESTATVSVSSAGRMLWQKAVLVFPARPYEIFPVENLIGATSCESSFPDARVAGSEP